VALQLPDNTRLTNKFASTSSLWQILRFFEDKGDPSRRLNLTQREVMSTNTAAGSGRLYYSQPTLNFMGREFGTFLELQKTLSQLGFGGGKGSLLLRLGFRVTQTPLEEAMEEIGRYFKSIESTETSASANEEAPSAAEAKATTPVPTPAPSASATTGAEATTESSGVPENINSPPPATTQAPANASDTATPPAPQSVDPPAVSGPVDASNRPTTVFSAPTSTTPQAARFNHDAADYEPTVEHAKLHQARLNHESRNKRLASDRELEQQESERLSKLASVAALDVRIRLPDQVNVQTAIGQSDTGASLYAYVRSLLAHPETPFVLRYVASNGRYADVEDSDKKKLIQGLGFSGKMALVLAWAPGVEVPSGPVLKQQYAAQAKAMSVPQFQGGGGGGGGATLASSAQADDSKGKGKMSGAEKESKLKGLLMKGFSKK
jgi:tether containing UBX domain for GLUT4